MIKVGAPPSILETEETAPEQPKKPFPMTAIPVTLAIGLVVAVGYVGNRILAPHANATTIFIAKPVPPAHGPANPQVPQPVGTTVASSAPVAPATSVTQPAAMARAATASHTPTIAMPGVVAPAVSQPPVASHAKESPAFVEVKTALPAPQPENPEGGSGQSSVDKDLGLIAPRPGERYLQIAAIATNMVPSFLADLKKYNVQASVAPGPHDGLVRIVIGPFADRDSAARAKDQIQTKWTDCFVRLY